MRRPHSVVTRAYVSVRDVSGPHRVPVDDFWLLMPGDGGQHVALGLTSEMNEAEARSAAARELRASRDRRRQARSKSFTQEVVVCGSGRGCPQQEHAASAGSHSPVGPAAAALPGGIGRG